VKIASRILILYLLLLIVCLLIFGWLGINEWALPVLQGKVLLSPIMIVTIIGGMIALKYALSSSSFRIFILIYCSLWIVRLTIIYIGNQIGQTTIGNKNYNIDFIISNYYRFVSRLDTPLPFIIYGLINYIFSSQHVVPIKEEQKKL
jgi:hypothetical protein